MTLVIADGAILSVGLVGNMLVVYVVARYARMKTVTNVYILNLSVADSLFLATTTSVLHVKMTDISCLNRVGS